MRYGKRLPLTFSCEELDDETVVSELWCDSCGEITRRDIPDDPFQIYIIDGDVATVECVHCRMVYRLDRECMEWFLVPMYRG